jgi:hypothetical protein
LRCGAHVSAARAVYLDARDAVRSRAAALLRDHMRPDHVERLALTDSGRLSTRAMEVAFDARSYNWRNTTAAGRASKYAPAVSPKIR